MAAKKGTPAKAKPRGPGSEDISWQAQKSAMTRDRILDAAVQCFIEQGYANVTTAKIAASADVSRGAMLHHFPSKTELIQAAVEYLRDKLIEDYTARMNAMPASLRGRARRRAGVAAYWEHLIGDLFTVYRELCVASRTDPELRGILKNSQQLFEQHVRASNEWLFAEWRDRGERFLLAMDVTRCMLEGLATARLTADQTARERHLMDYLADRLEEIFEKEEDSSAIGRHTAGA